MAVLGAAAGGGAITNFPISFAKSVTWACPCVMEAYVFVIGAGGSSGAVGSNTGDTARANGGTAGGCAVSKLTLAAQDYVIVVGACAAITSTTGTIQGSAGGASTFTDNVGSIATMTGSGGLAGTAHATNDLSAVAGGAASGGTLMNNAGGGVPAITDDFTVSSGGAVGLWEAGRIGATTTGGSPGNVESLPQGDDGRGLTNVPTSTWGEESSWFIPPLNLQMTLTEMGDWATYSLGLKRLYVPAGAKSVGQWQYAKASAATARYGFYPAPLTGGVGSIADMTYSASGGATLGAGGGGVLAVYYGSTAVQSSGGNGGVIVIPISLGS